ncbi:enoyl-CoA hydratase/isomerase family protein [Portibacter lacus]|uniref:Enoyl-CoA hydratase n=1 Tax=Portibacter lacus TaxID=1099794 RepID=A0AA37WE29_9BACT|nr:enoyl-CoA hydratase-related protein [Portibacter lacus]GLR16214.1 enoyl-CoA hydratase [Portibacter lacus]
MKFIKVEVSSNIATITLNRPDALNALNNDLIVEIGASISELDKDDEVHGIIITGSGEKAFAAGADIKGFPELDEVSGKALSQSGHHVFNQIENLSKPVIAAVNGYALGGGLELAMACHLRIASENAVFGMPETKLGLIPGYGGTQRLVHLIGKAKAMEYILTAEMMDAPTAANLGLVNSVAPSGLLIEASRDMLYKIAKRGPLAVSKAIESINASVNPEIDGFELEMKFFGELLASSECKEGVAAFIEKRKPVFRK